MEANTLFSFLSFDYCDGHTVESDLRVIDCFRENRLMLKRGAGSKWFRISQPRFTIKPTSRYLRDLDTIINQEIQSSDIPTLLSS